MIKIGKVIDKQRLADRLHRWRGSAVATWMVVIVLTCTGTLADAATPREGRARLEQYLADFVTLRANFEQLLLNEKGATVETAKGMVYLRRPGRFRWDYQTPYVQTIVADGEKVWIYDQELSQVTVKPLQAAIGNTPALLLGGKVDIDKQFDVTELGQRAGLLWVGLKPRGQDNQYYDIRLGFDGTVLRQMVLLDNLGQTTRIEFSGEQRNSELDPKLFIFTPPKGVDVINAKDL
jgi:outer membrane lipoprotein carrier protein